MRNASNWQQTPCWCALCQAQQLVNGTHCGAERTRIDGGGAVEGAASDAAERAEDGRRAKVRRGAAGPLLALRLLAGRRAQRRESCVRRKNQGFDCLRLQKPYNYRGSSNTEAMQWQGTLVATDDGVTGLMPRLPKVMAIGRRSDRSNCADTARL